jgi:hypothetical protein
LNPDFWHYSFDLVHSQFLPRPLEDSQANSFPLFIAEIFAEVESSPNSQQSAGVIELSCSPGDLRSFYHLRFPESAMTPGTSPNLKQETDPRIMVIRRLFRLRLEDYEFFLEIMKMTLSLGSSLHAFMNSLESYHFRSFEGERFLPNSPTLAPRGSRLTPTVRFHEQFLEFQ